jgi:hypothetical protein
MKCWVHAPSSAALKRARASLRACDPGVLKEGTGTAVTCDFLPGTVEFALRWQNHGGVSTGITRRLKVSKMCGAGPGA